MAQFRNLGDLQKYIAKNYGGNAVLSNGKSLRQLMNEESHKLFDLIQKYIDSYYLSYTPSQYERTYNFRNSLRIEPMKQIGNIVSVRIYFDTDMATHDSLWGGESGFVPILISEGFRWGYDPGIPRLSNFSGYDFIGMAIEEYNRTNKYGLKIKVTKEYSGKKGALITEEYN